MSWTNIWERETNSTSAESLCLEFEVVGSNLHGQVVNCRWKDIGQQTDVVFFAFVLCSDRTSLRTSLLSEVVTRTHHFTGNMFLPVSIPAGFQAFNKKRSAKNSQLPSFFSASKLRGFRVLFSFKDQYTIADMAIYPWIGGFVEGVMYGEAKEFLQVAQ